VSAVLHIGLLVNPLAGLGGSLALKGSDGQALRELAQSLPPEKLARSAERVRRALAALEGNASRLRFSTWGGAMGASVLAGQGFAFEVLGGATGEISGAADTAVAAQSLWEAGVDLLVFAGGDGTARDIADVVGTNLPVLGIPAGVKMHSGVFAVSPEAAGLLLCQLVRGELVGLRAQEVRDIDEEAFRNDIVRSRYYAEMQVPGEGRFLQHTKVGGRESQELVAAEIGEWLAEQVRDDTFYLLGPGSTTYAVKEALGMTPTLLGVDVYRGGACLASDADEQTLLQLLAGGGPAQIVVTAIGGQGHVFGRGNQQFSPAVIKAVGRDNITFVATKDKISALDGRPLLVDTNDAELDATLCGYYRLVTGYDDFLLYRVATGAEMTEEGL